MKTVKAILSIVAITSVTMLFTACGSNASEEGKTAATTQEIVLVDTSTEKVVETENVETTEESKEVILEPEVTSEETKYYENPEFFEEVWAGEDIIPIRISGDVSLESVTIYDKKDSKEPDSYEVGYLILKLKGNSKDFSIGFEDDIKASVDLGFTFIHCEDDKYEIEENDGMYSVYGFKPDQKEIAFVNLEIMPILEVNYEGQIIRIANIICYFE